MLLYVVTWVSIGNPFVVFKTSMSLSLKYTGFLSRTEVDGTTF